MAKYEEKKYASQSVAGEMSVASKRKLQQSFFKVLEKQKYWCMSLRNSDRRDI